MDIVEVSENKGVVVEELPQLTMKQQAFADMYGDVKSPFFANGTQCYMAIFKPKNAVVGASEAYRLLRKPQIQQYMAIMTKMNGFNDNSVDNILQKWMKQGKDGKISIQAIKEYNRLQSRITEHQKVETVNINDLLEKMTNDVPSMQDLSD